MYTAEKLRAYFESQIGEGRPFADRTKMARFLGLGTSTQTKFFSFLDGSATSYETVIEWMDRLRFSIVEPDEKLDAFSLVPMVEAEPGAGESFVTSNNTIGHYAFRDSFLARERIHSDKSVLMRVAGDSMEPMIRDGDTILVDSSETGCVLKDGQIFVMGLEDALVVKRVFKIPGGWRLRSENRERGDVDVIGEDLNSLRPYGRVRWIGRVI